MAVAVLQIFFLLGLCNLLIWFYHVYQLMQSFLMPCAKDKLFFTLLLLISSSILLSLPHYSLAFVHQDLG